MKLKTKMFILFLVSAILSVNVFLIFTYYELNNGYYSGVSRADMQNAVTGAANQIVNDVEVPITTQQGMKLLVDLNKSYPKMQFGILQGEAWVADDGLPKIANEQEVLQAIQNTLEDYIVTATMISEDKGYLICFVNKIDFEAMSYSFNSQRSSGILGKMGLMGLAIALLITGFILYLFTRRQVKRFENMQKKLQDFALEKVDTRMEVKGKDELAVMASNFNAMADKIEAQYNEKLQYDQNRQTLVTNLSHDLRTPLSSIMGYSEMLKDEVYESKEEEKQYIDIIHRKAKYMEYLLTELLEYSRLQLGDLKLDVEQMNLSELVRETMIEYLPEMEREQYQLEMEIPEEDIYGEWDKNRLGRVLRNLIDNALKYGMDGKRLRISLEKKDTYIILEVRDFGKGMSQIEKEHMFDLFYRADGARNSKRGGMGLGMYITQEIIRLHGGSVFVDSIENKGTAIKIELPL